MRRRRALAIDSPDVGALRRPARRTSALTFLLAGLAVALLLALVAAARGLEARDPGLLPRGTTGVVVIDLSLSVTDDDYRTVRSVLRGVASGDARIGLVIFSDVPYEVLPPGTPARELLPVLRLLVPGRGTAPSPWEPSFRSGTRISTALELAAEMVERDRIERPSILLVSDLQTAPDDVVALTRTVAALRVRSIPLRVSALRPPSDALALFAGLLEEGELTVAEDDGATVRRGVTTVRYPAGLLVLGALLFAVLALHEWLSARLGLPRPAGSGRSA